MDADRTPPIPNTFTSGSGNVPNTFNRISRIKGLKKKMAFRLSLPERLLDELQLCFPYQLDYRGRAYPTGDLIGVVRVICG
jgi:DNA-directed RNA polymerase